MIEILSLPLEWLFLLTVLQNFTKYGTVLAYSLASGLLL